MNSTWKSPHPFHRALSATASISTLSVPLTDPGTWSEIRIYRWDGTLAFQIDLDEWDSWDMEPESINIVDGHIYIMGEDEEFAVYEIILEEKG